MTSRFIPLNRWALAWSLAALVAGSSLGSASRLHAAENAERVPLTAVEYDTIWLTNGGQLVGLIVGTQADGAMRVERFGKPTTLVPKAEITRYERRQTLAEAVSRRGDQAIAANDWLDLQRTLRFAVDRPAEVKPSEVKPTDVKTDPAPVNPVVDPTKGPTDPQPTVKPIKKPAADAGVKDAAIMVAQKALTKKPTTEIAALAILLLTEKQDLDGVLGAAQLGVTADPNWTPGYEAQARIFIERKQDERMKALVKIWLERQPTAFQANRYLAKFSETTGDLRVAAEAYRKGFDLHQDWESALGYARCSLKRGDRNECMRAAKTLIEKNQLVAPAKVWLASALLKPAKAEAEPDASAQQATAQQATDLLTAGLAGELDAETADVARYNLGLLHERAGRPDEARKLWTQIAGPMGAVALAHLNREPITSEGLPPAMKAFTAEHNAAIDLENSRWQSVATGFDQKASRRAQFLGQIAMLLKNAGSDESLHNLSTTAGEESLRWQAYGLMLQSRSKDGEAMLDKLPVTDGWAIACRVYLASARKDEAGARSWLKRLDGATGVPKKYAAELLAEFASANDEETIETFDEWPTTDSVPTGWEVSAHGTNIVAHGREQRLVFEGTQAGTEPTSVYRQARSDRLRSVSVKLDLSDMKNATGGLEVIDEKRLNGLQVGASGGKVVWRAAEKGTWGPWTPADLPAVGSTAALRIELAKGVLYVALADHPTDRKAVTAGLGRGEFVAVGIFGVADPGTAWTLMADDFAIQLNPATRR